MAGSSVLDNEALGYFTTYSCLVILKMMAVGALTGYYRVSRKAYANEEDIATLGAAGKDKKPVFDNPDVERGLRCHRNDLENIVPFLTLGFLFAFFSGAQLSTIIWHYRVFVVSRFCHSVAYLVPLPQPSRGLAYFVGFLANVSMAVQILLNNWVL